ncbi:TPA: restriction endonuclease subunit S [Escherichia coli]|nr:restriction endonuclease subunit S [Escherichia coli]MDD8570321.1 restriction endonuclease subunit S [Escherichia coli]HBN0627501.1 restriction endonuclease subunit S [Escherichia coli]HCJ9918433.1 restriction endonuclease subunit S [Escherichia coli]
MSELSYLEKLLDGVEVEWRNLGDTSLFEIANNGRKPVKASLRIAGETPYYGANNIQDYVDGYTHDGEYVLIAEDGSASLENYSIQYATGKFWANNHVHVVRGKERVHSRFLYHYLCIVNFLPFLTGGGRAKLTKGQLIEIPVPIPCPDNPEKSLAIQSEIVRILDKFTALTAELTAELNMRKKQYNYYRDQLLSFDNEDVPHLPMGQKDIGEFIRGGTFQKKDFMDAGVGCIHYGQIYTYYGTYAKKTKTHISATLAKKCKKAQKGNLIIATTSENDEDVCKAVAWLGSEDIAVSSDACIYKHNLNPKYVSYFFQTEQFQNQKRQYITGAKVRRVNADNLSKILIPVPSMEIQERIVSILDKFDTLTNSITEGLPREIELRQKQYEYYRDLLFSFPKPETVSN